MMNNKIKVFALFIFIFLISCLFIAKAADFSGEKNDKIHKEVEKAFEKEDKVTVILKAKENKNLKSGLNLRAAGLREEDILRKQGDLIVARISKDELNKIEQNQEIEKVTLNHEIHASLQDSTGIVNATKTWPLQINGLNITGVDETACIIDTGINFSHSDLIGKNFTCIIDCFNKACVENCSVVDDNGHGTHVAGIVAANGTIKGIAPNARLIGVKILDANGNGHSTNAEIDLKNAIDWCVANRVLYNISVISMSLGTDTLFSSYCDSTFLTTWTPAINNATLLNVSVVSASANNGNTGNIASPACITNATAVSATDKNDAVASYSNFNSLVDLFAPGTSINSTYKNGGYQVLSGTSMATPHVAGAFALIRNFYRLQNNTIYSPKDIESALKNNGNNITTSTGVNITRINIYSAIISLDNKIPNATLISPVNGTTSLNANQTFRCNASDLSLKNVTFDLWNSTFSLINQTSVNITGNFQSFEVNVTNLSSGTYKWNCLYADENGNFAFASSNFSLTITSVSVNLISPSNNIFTNQNQTFQCNATSSSSFSNVTFYIWNSTNSLVNNTLRGINGTFNSTNFSFNFTYQDNYNWNCLFINNLSTQNFASSNFSLTYDLTSPNLTIISPVNGSTINSGRFNATLNENGSCQYSLNAGANNFTMSGSDNRTFNATNSTLVQNGNYTVNYYCNDTAGNRNNSQTSQFSVDLTSPGISLISPSDGYSETASSSILNFIFNVSDNINISSCSLILNGAASQTNSAITNQSENQSITQAINSGSYTWGINCSDIAGNFGNSSLRSLTITAPSVSSSGGGSGGGGGGGAVLAGQTYTPSKEQTSGGYTQELKKEDKIKFFDEIGSEHSLSLDYVGEYFANITIKSDPIKTTLAVGQSIKLNMTSGEYYNLYIKLDEISNGKARLTIQIINDPIAKTTAPAASEGKNESLGQGETGKKEKGFGKYIGFLIISIIIVGFIFYIYRKTREKLKEEIEKDVKKDLKKKR